MNRPRSPFIPIILALLFIPVLATNLLSAAPVTSLQQAYNQANNGDVIRIYNAVFAENLLLNRPIAVNFDGGYTDTTYTAKGGVTALQGTLTIGDGILRVAGFTIRIAASGGNPPVISTISVTAPAVTWSTNQSATSRVDYGETASYGRTVTSAVLSTSHTLTLTGLQTNSTYHYRIVSTNSAGQTASSNDATFSTPAFVAATVAEFGAITVMEASGFFDTNNPDTSPNTVPRQELARQFINNHGDGYDFLVILTTFPVTMPTASTKGLYTAIKNDTQGIGAAGYHSHHKRFLRYHQLRTLLQRPGRY